MASKQAPEWLILLYRGLRPAVASGIAQTLLLHPDWSDWQSSWKNIAVIFFSGFLPVFGKWARERLDEWLGWDEKSLAARIFPV